MYVPGAFQQTDLAQLHEFMENYSFATVVTTGPAGLQASHVPVLLDRSAGPQGTVFGHLARQNPQVNDLGSEALIVFSGPHAYVSPTWYQEPRTVPTWNYVAVHATGRLDSVEDPERLAEILKQSVTRYESSRPSPWLFDPVTEFHEQLMRGIVGFQMPVTRLEGKWKLSQNHSVPRRQRVIAALEEQGTADALAVASLMRDALPPESTPPDAAKAD